MFKTVNHKTMATRSYASDVKPSLAVRDSFRQDMPSITEVCPISGRPTMVVVAKMGKRALSIWVESNTSGCAGYPDRTIYERASYTVTTDIKPIADDPEGDA